MGPEPSVFLTIHVMYVPIYPPNKDNTGTHLLPPMDAQEAPGGTIDTYVILYSVLPTAVHFAVVCWLHVSTMNPKMSRWSMLVMLPTKYPQASDDI
jgi:hypothetical protein